MLFLFSPIIQLSFKQKTRNRLAILKLFSLWQFNILKKKSSLKNKLQKHLSAADWGLQKKKETKLKVILTSKRKKYDVQKKCMHFT